MVVRGTEVVCTVCEAVRPGVPSSGATGDDDLSAPLPPRPAASPASAPSSRASPGWQAGVLVHGGRYQLIKLLGRGGMGEVWLAEDTILKRQVAAKMLPLSTRSDLIAMESLRRETARGQALTHPNIVRVHDLHEDADCAVLTMELVDGLSLAALRQQQPGQVFRWDWLAPIVRQLCEALAYAHEENVIHRDLKPANLMVDSRGRLKLADFGIAATLSETWNHATQYLPKAGTISYMSPQQLDGLLPRPTDDVYALGAMLYHLLTGTTALPGTNAVHHVKHTPPQPLHERLAELRLPHTVPAEVEQTIHRCLAKRADDRPQSALALLELLGLQRATAPVVTVGGTESGLAGSSRMDRSASAAWAWLLRSFRPLLELPHHKKRWLASAVSAGVTAMLGIALLHTAPGSVVVNWSYDWAMLGFPRDVPQEAVVVYLDDESYDRLGKPDEAAWRGHHAKLVEHLHRDGAKVIVFDIVFDTPKDAATDARFTEALRSAGNVILAGNPPPEAAVPRGDPAPAGTPLPALARAASGWGHATIRYDPDLTIRRLPEAVGDRPSLAHAAWGVASGTAAGAVPQPRAGWLRYYGPAGFVPWVSYHEVSNAPAGFFRDRAVFVGDGQLLGARGDRRDSYRNPFWLLQGASYSPGVEVHATAFLNLLRHEWLTRPGPGLELAVVLLGGALIGYVLALLRPGPGLLAAGLAVPLLIALHIVTVRWGGIWFPWTVWLAQGVLALGLSSMINTLRSRYESRLLEQALAVHLPPRRVKQILRNTERLRPGTEKREVTILFTTIADFAAIADRTLPDKLYPRLNAYFTELVSCVHEADGAVIKLTGEGVFAVWNAPDDQPENQVLACRAALATQTRLQAANNGRLDFPFHTRVGLHFGTVAVGNFGSLERMDYTAVGSNVELAARLADLNKLLGTQILATGAIVAEADRVVAFRALGWVKLPDFARVIEVSEVLGLHTDSERRDWVATFEGALAKFRDRQFGAAIEGFQRVLGLRPEDGPSRFYLARSLALRENPPVAEWLGEIHLPTSVTAL